ncbi:hypothetical protein GH810_05745 [Acetobacterium paludosum]|uniref:Uncharacterized protein n=1 Tax=Acetobacterium paludosum TaxID=52693 RepID=A0A923KW94_9FIRM|nr:hypothetical protein [Acetobacterium paludosum]MBC3887808.1 hypothetical protein [Acetobacterium paludosum]
MNIPMLKHSNRKREYNLYNQNQIDEVVYCYLFDAVSHRKLDQVVLGLDSAESHGYQAMGILHYLGVTKEFKGLFSDIELEKTIDLLSEKDGIYYSEIIDTLKSILQKSNDNKQI